MPTELALPAPRQNRSVTARFLCDRCGAIAATVTLTPPGARNPLVPPGDDDRAMLLARALPDWRSLAIDGPLRVTYGVGPAPVDGPDRLLLALEAADPAAVAAIDPEFASFRCPFCRKCYCGACWRVWTTYDACFYDATYGRCPDGHIHKMDD